MNSFMLPSQTIDSNDQYSELNSNFSGSMRNLSPPASPLKKNSCFK